MSPSAGRLGPGGKMSQEEAAGRLSLSQDAIGTFERVMTAEAYAFATMRGLDDICGTTSFKS